MANDEDSVGPSDLRSGGSSRLPRTGDAPAGASGGMSRWAIAPYSVAGQSEEPAPTPKRSQKAVEDKASDWTPPVVPARTPPKNRQVERDSSQPTELQPAAQLGTRPNTVLAGFGGVVLIIVVTAIGASADVILNDKVGIWSGVALIIGAFFASLMTRKSDLLSVIVAPPIIYTFFAALSVWLTSTNSISVTALADVAVSGFAPMALATGVAALLGGIKLLTTRAHERP